MTSRDELKSALVKTGNQCGYTGEMVEIAADLLSYVLYQNQIEIANASQESSLATAKLMNSKIHLCMESMYSVYRGKNARVLLNFKSNTLLNKKKFDLLYESNTFKVYAANNFRLTPETELEHDKIEGIFVAGTKYEYEVVIDENNKYYIDLVDANGHLMKDLGEDIMVTIDGVEYPTTRDFYEHINTPVSEDLNSLDKVFVLTIPDYGVRIYKRGHIDQYGNVQGFFKVGSIVKVQALRYTTFSEINTAEYNKIQIPGTELMPIIGTAFEYEATPCTIKGYKSDESYLPLSAAIGDTYVIDAGLYSYLSTTIPNPNYVAPENNPRFISHDGFTPQEISGIGSYLSDRGIEKLTLKSKLPSTQFLPTNGVNEGDTYFITNTPYVFCTEGGVLSFYAMTGSLATWVRTLFNEGVQQIQYKGNKESTSFPYNNNVLGDCYTVTSEPGVTYVYLKSDLLNPDYVAPEDNPEYIVANQFVNIGSISDYSEVNGMLGRESVSEVARDTAESILYNANLATRTQSRILSSSDACSLFTEYFNEYVTDTVIRYNPADVKQGETVDTPIADTLYAFYSPKAENFQIPRDELLRFISERSNYFVTNNLECYPAVLGTIQVELELSLSSYEDISSEITEVFDQYKNVLTKRSSYAEQDFTAEGSELTWDYDYYEQLINFDQLYSQLSKLKNVSYLNKLSFKTITIDEIPKALSDNKLPTSTEVTYSGVSIRVPMYYNFSLSINYRNIYETVSK